MPERLVVPRSSPPRSYHARPVRPAEDAHGHARSIRAVGSDDPLSIPEKRSTVFRHFAIALLAAAAASQEPADIRALAGTAARAKKILMVRFEPSGRADVVELDQAIKA